VAVDLVDPSGGPQWPSVGSALKGVEIRERPSGGGGNEVTGGKARSSPACPKGSSKKYPRGTPESTDETNRASFCTHKARERSCRKKEEDKAKGRVY